MKGEWELFVSLVVLQTVTMKKASWDELALDVSMLLSTDPEPLKSPTFLRIFLPAFMKLIWNSRRFWREQAAARGQCLMLLLS